MADSGLVLRNQLEELVRKKCSLPSVRDFQLDCGLNLVGGRDLFLAVAPGMGKTAVMAAPLLMAQHRKERGIALVVEPTKILTEQQVLWETFASYGLRALAINEDTLRHARYEKRDLLAELASGDDIRIAVVSPWMLKNDKLQQLVASRKIRGLIRWFWIDEIHLANKNDPTVWREAYTSIIFMRPRLSAQTIWAGFTGTVTLTETRLISHALGFRPGFFMNARYSLDRHHVKIIPRFMEHSVSGNIFLDLSFLIPLSLSSATEIPSTLVFCQTIELGHRVGAFLDTLLPATLENRDRVVMPCNALLDADYRERFKARMDTGITRIGIVTDTCTYGLNVHATRVIIVLPSDLGGYSRLVQQAGRVSRNGALGLIYVLAPAWTRNVPESEIKTKTDKENQARRARAPKVIIDLLNATSAFCPRQVHCAYYDEPFVQPTPCCSLHDPEPEQSADAALVLSWQERIQPKPAPKKSAPRTDGTHLVPTSRMKASVSRLLDHWKIKHWPKYRPPHTDETSAAFLPTSLITRLAEKLHVCTTMERFGKVVGNWEYMGQAGERLFEYIQELLHAFDEVYIDTQLEADSDASVDDDIEEIRPPPGHQGSATKLRLVVKPKVEPMDDAVVLREKGDAGKRAIADTAASVAQPTGKKRKTKTTAEPVTKKARSTEAAGKENSSTNNSSLSVNTRRRRR